MTVTNNTASTASPLSSALASAAPYVITFAEGVAAEGAKLAKAEESLESRLMTLAANAAGAAAKSGTVMSEAAYNAAIAPALDIVCAQYKAVAVYKTQLKTAVVGMATEGDAFARLPGKRIANGERRAPESLRDYYKRVSPLLKAKGLLAPTKRDASKAGKPNAGVPVAPSQGVAAGQQDAKAATAAATASKAQPVKTYNRDVFVSQLATLARMSDVMAGQAAELIGNRPASFAAWVKAEIAAIAAHDKALRGEKPAAPKAPKAPK